MQLNCIKYLKKDEVDKIFLNFSDPWPKSKHAKRRLTSSKFLDVYKDILIDEGNIEFKNVGFEYKENVPVLKDVNFKLEKGKSIAFVGATGSGKSTIMNLILGFYENQKGEILLDGQNIKTLSKASYRKHNCYSYCC